MTITERLLAATEDIWEAYHSHPFVMGLGDGSLDREKFRYYIIQDYIYLIDYVKVFAIGVSKARDIKVMQHFAGYIDQILSGEMDIHNGYMGQLGITQEEIDQARMSLDNLSYTSYMIRVAYDEGPAEITAAILSCALSYEVIAKKLLEANPDADKHPFYGDWVAGYASDQYHNDNQKLVKLMDELAADYTEKQISHLIDIFVACSRYEGLFWDMAWEMRN